MFGIGLPELILILGIALIVVGPEKLPEMAKSIAKVMLDMKKTASSLKESLNEEMKDDSGMDPWQQNLGDAHSSLPSTIVSEAGLPEIDAVSPSGIGPEPTSSVSVPDVQETDAVSPPDIGPELTSDEAESKAEKQPE